MRLLGIDYGTHKIGLALSQEGIATPHAVLANTPACAREIVRIAEKEGVTGIVVGKSVDLRRRENPVMRDIKHFVAELKRATDLPIHFEDEVYTTKAAERIQGRHAKIDASAAALILQSFIDCIRNRKGHENS